MTQKKALTSTSTWLLVVKFIGCLLTLRQQSLAKNWTNRHADQSYLYSHVHPELKKCFYMTINVQFLLIIPFKVRNLP